MLSTTAKKNVMVNNNYNSITISTYIINSKEGEETSFFLKKKFGSFSEFDLTIMETCTHKTPDAGLWKSMVNAVGNANDNNDDVIIICDESHEFTGAYSKDFLFSNIVEANKQGAAILLGGAEGFGHAVPLNENRFWIDAFTGCEFTILYKKIFNKILNYKFKKNDSVDQVLSELTSHKMILYPFISKVSSIEDLNRMPLHQTIDQLPGTLKKTGTRLEQLQVAYRKYKGIAC